MRRRLHIPGSCFILAVGMMVLPLQAQVPVLSPDAMHDAPPPRGDTEVALPVADGVAPAGTDPEQWFELGGQYGVRNVTRPTLTVIPPKAGTATGAAVIVAPGGGFNALAWSNEGRPVAERLAERGIATFILKYRLEPTPRDKAGYIRVMRDLIAKLQSPGPRWTLAFPPATADATAAIRYLRKNAGRYGVDPHRIGILGFSAGAVVGLGAATVADPADRPDFAGLIYGPLAAKTVPTSPPPLFVARAADDPLYAPLTDPLPENFGLLSSWAKSGGSVEFHLYAGGGHGFGMQRNGQTSEGWIDQFLRWMQSRQLLQRR